MTARVKIWMKKRIYAKFIKIVFVNVIIAGR